MTKLTTLPEAVQQEIKSTLCAYDRVTVTKGINGYSVMAATVLHNGPCDEYVGEFKAADVFTPEERVVNYVNTFRDYPISYKGRKDYLAIRTEWKTAALISGNIEFFS